MTNCKTVFLLIFSLVIGATMQAQQTMQDFFDSYAEKDSFRYVSLSSDMVNLANLFGKNETANRTLSAKIDDVKVLTLKAARKSGEAKEFFAEIEKQISSTKIFQTLMEARENNVHTKVLIHENPNSKSDIVIISKSDSMQHFIWLRGSLSTEELQDLLKK